MALSTTTGNILANNAARGNLKSLRDLLLDYVSNIYSGIAALIVTSSLTMAGTLTVTPQIVTAAGATQGAATAITGQKAVITVALTASTKGVKLPTAATGLEVEVANAATFGVKVYPSTNGKIGAASTNTADTVLAINKVNRYIAVNTTLWAVQRGA